MDQVIRMYNLCGLDEVLALKKIFDKENIDINISKQFISGMLFYAYLSIKQVNYLNKELENDNVLFEDAYNDDELKEALIGGSLDDLGYFIKPEDTFQYHVKSIEKDNFNVEQLFQSLNNIEYADYTLEFLYQKSIFDELNLRKLLLKIPLNAQTRLIKELLIQISVNEYIESNTHSFILRISDEYQNNAFVNSTHIFKLIRELISIKTNQFDNIYCPMSNINLLNYLFHPWSGLDMKKITCQSIDEYKLALMRMYQFFEEESENIEIDPYDILFDDDSEKMGYDLIISILDEYKEELRYIDTYSEDDKRFKEYVKLNNQVQDSVKCTHLYIQHMLYNLNENGIMAIIVLTEHIFQRYSEYLFLKYMQDNVLETIIKLPPLNHEKYSLLIFKKNSENTLFIDSTNMLKYKGSNKRFFDNTCDDYFYHPLMQEKFKNIIEVYQTKKEIKNFSHIITAKEKNQLRTFKDYSIMDIEFNFKKLSLKNKCLKEHRFPAPPWIRIPDIPLGSMGWRMGYGESYLMRYEDYIDDYELYKKLFPRPITWNWIKEADDNLSDEMKEFIKHSGGKYKFFTKDGKPTYNIDYNLEQEYLFIDESVLDLRYEFPFNFALTRYTTALEFIEEEKDKPLYEQTKYTLCLNANYSKIVTDKKIS